MKPKLSFALRNRLTATVIINNQIDLMEILENEKIDINLLEQLDEKNWMIGYKTKEEEIVEHDCSNIIIALWTTSAARVYMLQNLYKLCSGRPDVIILYMVCHNLFFFISYYN